MKNIPIYIVSLKRDTERRNKINQAFKQLNIEYRFVDAIDARSPQIDALIQAIKIPAELHPIKGEIACSLSHQKIYQHMIEHDIPWSIILEDDISFDIRFKQLIDSLNNGDIDKLRQNCIYILGGQNDRYARKTLALSLFNAVKTGNIMHRKVTYKPSKLSRTCCYIISKPSCEKLIQLFKQRFYLADDWGLFYKKGIVKEYYLTEIIEHPPVSFENSHLEEERYQVLAKKTEKNRKRKSTPIGRMISYLLRKLRNIYYSFQT